MRLAIVGARLKWWGSLKRCEEIRKLVFSIVSGTHTGVVIVSGDSPGGGVDAWAREAAKHYHREFVGYPPNITENMTREQYANACHARNQRVVDESNEVIAIVAPGCKGTWDAVRRAKKAGKLREVLKP